MAVILIYKYTNSLEHLNIKRFCWHDVFLEMGHVQTEFVQKKGRAFGLWMKAFKLYLY